MQAFWYAMYAAMVGVYVVLDGFDFGVGVVQLWAARTDAERLQARAAIGPFWDGNEVWLLASGGVLFFAFPAAYAAGFSGFYLPLFLVLWLLIGRGLAMELRHHGEGPLWGPFWDVALAGCSGLLAVVLGAALGNVIRGVPLDGTGEFSLPLFDFSGAPGVLDPYTVGVGLFTLLGLSAHGALFLAWKTEGALQARARAAARLLGPLALLVLVPVTWDSHRIRPELFAHLGERALAWPLLAAAAAGFGLAVWGTAKGRDGAGFAGSSALLLGILGATAAGMFPVLLASTEGAAFTLDAFNAAAADSGLAVGLNWWLLGLPLVCVYFAVLFRLFRGKVAQEH
jgi:cytochrome d ubiquinol oxidase subunit II